jgi:PhnB protein
MFHLHEETERVKQLSPERINATTVLLGLFIADPDAVVQQAVAAGAAIVSPIQDFEYGYRQAVIADPFVHQWIIQKRI